MSHHEVHRSHRMGWLRAVALGANDGIVSTASLMHGVAAAQAAHADIPLARIDGLVAGAMSMAAGENVSVSSQADTEKADLEIEKNALRDDIELENRQLANMYMASGLAALPLLTAWVVPVAQRIPKWQYWCWEASLRAREVRQ